MNSEDRYIPNPYPVKQAVERLFSLSFGEGWGEAWELAANNYKALAQVKTKTFEVGGCTYKVQFNPARITSSAAKVDPKSIQERKCFLCPANLPPVQKGIPFKDHYSILVNPFPIFPRHLTIPDVEHVDQRILPRIGDMLDLAETLDDYIIFYNGPKCGASAPDHMHFQAGNKGFLPIEEEWKHKKGGKIVDYKKATLWFLNDAPRATLTIEAENKEDAITLFKTVYRSMELKPGDDEPMMNVLAWYEDHKWIVCIFPRELHRPTCYSAEGDDNILISPASVDMGGVFITPLEKDFDKITAGDIANILSEVCSSNVPQQSLLIKHQFIPMIEPKVNVGILFEPRIDFVFLPRGGAAKYSCGTDTEISGKQTVTYSDGKILWQGRLYEELLFEPIDESLSEFEILDVTIGINFHWERKEDQRFKGAFKVIVEDNKLTGINVISVEDYLTSVISSEMSATASLELLKAHAVISRSWLLASLTPALSKGEGERNAMDNIALSKQHYHTANCTSYNCLKEKQKELKKNPTETEKIIWNLIRDNKLGEKFRRQHIISDYIVDFICLTQKLIIEIDGEYHNDEEQIKRDSERTSKLNELGFKVIRFTNNEVITNPESVIQTIHNSLNPTPALSKAKRDVEPHGETLISLSFGEGRGEAVSSSIRWYERSDHTHFDVCADDHCQRYQGITRASTEIVKQAIEATRGQVLTYDNKICDARFSKCCGGAFEEFQNCWEDIKYPYLAKQRDSKSVTQLPDLTIESEAEKWIRTSPEAFCNTTDKVILSQVLNNYDQETVNFYRWKVEYSQRELSELIRERSGIDFGDILDLIPVERGTSGRLVKLKIVGTKRTLIIGKELEIRRTLSTSHLYSSAFVVDKSYTASPQPSPKEREQAALSSDNNAEAVGFGGEAMFTLTGAGWGHGVGLCQIGAAVMGEKGYPYNEILLHYYIGARIEKLYE